MSNFCSIDTQDLVSSKENIQPLRRGRDTSILSAALQAETDTDAQKELERQRNEFEIKLRSNTTNDPLADWCSYVHWIEQSFPKQGREGKLNVVLQKCLNKFKDNKEYMNDIRFVKLCIKYAELEDNTVELLSQIHRHGIGVLCAELYIAWAEKYAVDSCFKKANAVYDRGIKCSAQPLQLLQESYKNFQAFLVRKMLNDRETFQPTILDESPGEQRQPYNILQTVKSGQKEVIPSIRVGSNVIGTAGKFQKVGQVDQKSKSNTMVKIFEDTEGNIPSAEPAAKIEKINSKKVLTKENTVKPGTWNNKKNKNVPFKVDLPSNPQFQVHRDEDDESVKEARVVPSAVLKVHKVKPSYEDENFANAPLFYPEPYDPTRLSMYCKEQVYAGGLEFQFEELRAIQYRRKRQEAASRNCLYPPKVAETVTCCLEEVPPPPSATKSESHSKVNSEKTKKKTVGSTEKKVKNNDTKRKTIFSNPLPIVVPEENLPNTDYSMNQTINTKEALSEMQQLWFSKPASPVPVTAKPSKPAAKSILKPSKPCFSLYVDESCLENFKQTEEDKPLDLTFKVENRSEDEKERSNAQKVVQKAECENLNTFGGARKKNGLGYKIKCAVGNKENCYAPEVFDPTKIPTELKVDDEDKENGVPADYCGPVGKSTRTVSGILTPAENVEIADLSDEEVEIDEEEREEEQDEARGHDYSSIIRCNTTAITETWNFTKGFQFPRGESTPNIRKSYHKVDCDDSVFLPQPVSNVMVEKPNENQTESKREMEKLNSLQAHEKKTNGEGENFTKNLSVIAETSREYRSSSSGSSGASTMASRHSKNFPYTPSDVRNSKYNLTASQTTLQKGKFQSYTSYEASSESSQTALKTPLAHKGDVEFNATLNLMKKLNAIDSTLTVSESSKTAEGTHVSYGNIKKDEVQQANDPVESIIEKIDPFSDEVIENLLRELDFPGKNHSAGYYFLNDVNVLDPKLGSSLTLGAFNFHVKKVLGEGSYARIFRIADVDTGDLLIAKYQKPAFPWEFYITREIQARIRDSEALAMFMNVEYAYFFKNASVLLTRPVEFGDLLAVINKMQQAKMMCQGLAMHFTCQILKILEILHSCKIIHGDIKPDNFLLRRHNDKLHLQLIDFGRSIDMSLFPEGTTFTRVVTTEGLTTVEMKLGKPWTYQIDYYGAANCAHTLLFGEYMKVVEKGGVWNISKTIPRYWARNEWKNFFVSLINAESCSNLPVLSELRQSFEDILVDNADVEFGLNKLNNLLNDR